MKRPVEHETTEYGIGSTILHTASRPHSVWVRFEDGWRVPAGGRGSRYDDRWASDCLSREYADHEWVAGAYGGARRDKYEAKYVRKGGYVPADKEVVKRLLGVEHDMTWNGLFECIPPAYSEHIGMQLRSRISDDSTPLDDDVCDDCHGSECLACADCRRYHEDRDTRLEPIE